MYSSEKIKALEQLHYTMQLGGYFTELKHIPGADCAFTTRFTDVWYNQAYNIDNTANPRETLESIENYFRERDRHSCVYTSVATNKSFVSELEKQGYGVFEEESWMFAPVINEGSDKSDFKISAVIETYEDFATVYRLGLPGPEVEDYIEAAIHIHKNTPEGIQIDYLIAYQDNQPVGMLGLHLTNQIGGVYAVATVPEFRGKGVANALNSEAHKLAQAANCTHLMLQTVSGETSEKVFKKMGYQTEFIRTGYVPAKVAKSLTHG